MSFSVELILAAFLGYNFLSDLQAFTKKEIKDVFVGTPVNNSILDLMTYFPGRPASELKAWLTDTSSPKDCSSDYTVGKDLILQLQRRLTKPDGNQPSCIVQIWIWETRATVHVVTVTIKYYGCWPNTDDRGIYWKAALPESTIVRSCPEPSTGHMSRKCSPMGMFLDPVNNCTRSRIGEILFQLRILLRKQDPNRTKITEALNELSMATISDSSGLAAKDVEFTVNALKHLTEKKFSKIIKEKTVYPHIFDITNNLLDVNNTRVWQSFIDKESVGAEQLVTVMDRTMMHVVDDSGVDDTHFISYQKENLMLSMGSTIGCSEVMVFPNRTAGTMDWVRDTKNSIQLPCVNLFGSNSFSGTYYKNISKLISTKTQKAESSSMEINSGILTFTLYPRKQKRLQRNIELKFDLYDTKMRDPVCSFWKAHESLNTSGYWSPRGCHLEGITDGVAICSCDHLTNFAILMSPVETPDGHLLILSAISIAGCILSMIFLLITISIYAAFWRHLTVRNSDGPTVLINLCASLFVAYLIFLAGVSRTENKAGCIFVAALLHFMFLVVFGSMMAKGVLLLRMVLWPLSTSTRIAWKMLIVVWAAPAIVVAVSLGATRTEGYGNKKFCWLSADSGIIWVFVGPALAIILANCVIIGVVLWKMMTTTAMKNQSETQKVKHALRSFVILVPLVGISWIFGVFAMDKNLVVFQYIFVILNTLQGLAIFIFHCVMNKQVREALKRTKDKLLISRSLDKRKKGPSETDPRQNEAAIKNNTAESTPSTQTTKVAAQDDMPYRSTN